MPIQYFCYLRMVSPCILSSSFQYPWLILLPSPSPPLPSRVISQVMPMTQITLSLIKPSVSVSKVDCLHALCSETFLHSFNVFIALSISLKIDLLFYLVFEIII